MRFLSSPRARLGVVGVAVAGVLVLLGVSGFRDNLVYYRTPTEVASGATQPGDRVRLGGMVAHGSVSRVGGVLRFVLTDGARDVPVVYRGKAPGIFREGQGAVVEGDFRAGRRFVADSVLVKHSNEYVAKGEGEYRPPNRP